MSNATDYLMGGGLKGAQFVKGVPVRGTITAEPEVKQQTDYNSKEPKFFKNGDPMMQLVVTVTTDQRSPEIDEDDGTRGFYVKGKQMTQCVRDAVRAARGKGLEVGGVLTMTWVDGGPRYEGDQTWGKDNPKVYTAVYEKPANQAAAAFLANGGEPNAPAGQPASPPQWAQAAPAAAPATAAPAGIDPAIWAQMGPDQQAKVLAAIGS